MGVIRWKNVVWRGGAGFSGSVDDDMTVMIFPATPDRKLPTPFGMFIFSKDYDAEACRTGRHIPIPIDSLEDGQRRAEDQDLAAGLQQAGAA